MQRTVFHAYKSTSDESYLSPEEATPLLKKLFTCPSGHGRTGELLIYTSLLSREPLPVLKVGDYVTFNHEQMTGLLNFLKCHKINCEPGSETIRDYELKYITLPQFQSMDAFVTKMETIIPPQARVDVGVQTDPERPVTNTSVNYDLGGRFRK